MGVIHWQVACCHCTGCLQTPAIVPRWFFTSWNQTAVRPPRQNAFFSLQDTIEPTSPTLPMRMISIYIAENEQSHNAFSIAQHPLSVPVQR